MERSLTMKELSKSSQSTTASLVASNSQNRADQISTNVPHTDTHEIPLYLGNRALMLLMLGLTLAVLTLSLDMSVLGNAIPQITDDFQTIADIGWYVAAYNLSNAAFQPLTGKLYTYLQLKYTFLGFLAVFELGSLMCALAKSSAMLVVSRAVAGLGSSGMINGALTILAVAAEPTKRPTLIGIVMAVSGVGQLLGPLVGGSLTEHVSWRWCFWINLPIGALVIGGMLLIKFPPYRRQSMEWTSRNVIWNLDLVGFSFFAPACTMLLLALQWGGSEYEWSSATIVGLFCGSVGTFGVFFFWEHRLGDRAMIPISLIQRRVVYSSLLSAFFQFGGLLISAYYLPLWFQVIKGISPTLSAVYTLPTLISQIVAIVIAGIITSRTGYLTPLAVLGGAFGMISNGLMSTFSVGSGAGEWIGYQILSGLGRGMSAQQPIQAVQTVVRTEMIPVATATVAWAQTLGIAVLIGLGQTVFINVLPHALAKYAPSVNVDDAINAGATNFIEEINRGSDVVLQTQVLLAYNEAVTRVFYLALGSGCVGLIASFGIGKTKVETRKDKSKAKVDEPKV